jgi:hypothetical protein
MFNAHKRGVMTVTLATPPQPPANRLPRALATSASAQSRAYHLPGSMASCTAQSYTGSNGAHRWTGS